MKEAYWAKYHLQHLRRWREAVEAIARAVKDLNIKAELYVIGGAAESRLTVLSDIDVLLCLEEGLSIEDSWMLRRRVLRAAMEKYGLPIDYPIEPHIQNRETYSETLQRRKVLKVDISAGNS